MLLPPDRQPAMDELRNWKKVELKKYFFTLVKESSILSNSLCQKSYLIALFWALIAEKSAINPAAIAATDAFSSLLAEGKLPPRISINSNYMKGERLTHPEVWMLGYYVTASGKCFYKDYAKNQLQKWWKEINYDSHAYRRSSRQRLSRH
ncbi:hypothetical protein OROMI_027967 [Orobanche minor]